MKLSELVEGEEVYLDAGFTCMKAGFHTVKKNSDGEFYVECEQGQHLLDGQCDETDEMIGVFKEKPNDL